MPVDSYTISIDVGGEPAFFYAADLAALNLAGNAITVLASGFLNPAENNDGPEFGLWVTLNSGGDLIPLALTELIEEEEDPNSIAFLNVGELSVYPNPTTEQVFVDIQATATLNLNAEIISVDGKKVYTSENLEIGEGFNRLSFELGTLTNGIYFLNLIDTENFNTEVTKLIIQK